MTKVISIAIEIKSSRGIFSSIAIELKTDGHRALKVQSHGAYDRLRPVCDLYKTSRVR